MLYSHPVKPVYPPELFERIFSFHQEGGGRWEHALDVGCGPGTISEVLAKRFSCSVVGSDINALQLDNANKRFKHLAPKVSFCRSPGENLSWAANSSVDLVTCAEAIHC